jgi:hypothetical protein
VTREKSIKIFSRSRSGEVVFSGSVKDLIFSKKCIEMPLPMPATITEAGIDLGHGVYYNVNNYKYRGPDYIENIDIIAAGCSFTYGIGVPLGGTWSDLLSKLANNSYVNVSMPGASIPWIVDSIFRYIETFGPPKIGIVALLPDLTRADVIVNKHVTTATETNKQDFFPQYYDESGVLSLISLQDSNDSPPMYLKRPYPVEHIHLNEEAIRHSVDKIKLLEQYCTAAGIPLIWSSWSDITVTLADSLIGTEYEFTHYVSLSDALSMWKSHFYKLDDPEGIVDYKMDHWGDNPEKYSCSDEKRYSGSCICFSTCHFDLSAEYGESFHMGSDRYVNPGNAHYGVHRHIHMADTFYHKMKEAGFYGI